VQKLEDIVINKKPDAVIIEFGMKWEGVAQNVLKNTDWKMYNELFSMLGQGNRVQYLTRGGINPNRCAI